MDVLRPWQKYPWTFYDHGLFVEKNAFFMKIPESRINTGAAGSWTFYDHKKHIPIS